MPLGDALADALEMPLTLPLALPGSFPRRTAIGGQCNRKNKNAVVAHGALREMALMRPRFGR
jgi:hypothetical protein